MSYAWEGYAASKGIKTSTTSLTDDDITDLRNKIDAEIAKETVKE